MQSRRTAIACVLPLALFAVATVAPGGEPIPDEMAEMAKPTGDAATDAPDGEATSESDAATSGSRVPLHRFYNTQLHVHIYTYKKNELAAWRKLKHMDEQKIIGYVSTKAEPGTQRLWRAVRPNGKHHFYIQAPRRAKNVRVESREFQAYVWKNGTDGRIPIHATSWTDGTDMYFDPEKKNIERYSENTKKALGVMRPDYGVIFYVYPKASQEPGEAQP